MGVKCEISFQEVKGNVFRAGNSVIGKLEYIIDKPTNFERIDLVFVGKGICFWSESDSADTRFHHNEEEYVSVHQNVRRGETVEAGTYAYQFKFLLPQDIPTSIKTNHCTIKYKVIAVFMKANLFNTTKKFGVEIPVLSYVEPFSPEPRVFKLKQEKINEEINVEVEIEKRFVAPGEDIKLKVTIHNDPDNPIKFIKSELIKYLTCISNTGRTFTESGPVRNTKRYSPKLKTDSETIHTCVVPTTPNSCSIQNSKLLKGEYKVRVTAKYPLFHSNASVDIPVVIGERRESHRVELQYAVRPSTSKMPDNFDSDVNGYDSPVVRLI